MIRLLRAACCLTALASSWAFLSAPFTRHLPSQQAGSRMSMASRGRELYSLIINPSRKGISTVSIEDIKAKKLLVEIPSDLKGAVLVSGSMEEEIFQLLHEQRVWDKITTFTPDTSVARKRLVSRTTRYSGLLDLLAFEQGEPTDLSQLKHALGQDGTYCAWLDVNTAAYDVESMMARAQVAVGAGVKYYITTVPLTVDQLKEGPALDFTPVAKYLQDNNVKYRMVVTGPVVEAPATGFVNLNDTQFLAPNATITRGDLSRIATELFLVQEKANATVLYATQGDDMSAAYLRSLREQGLSYKQEITDQLSGGLSRFVANVPDKAALEKAVTGGLTNKKYNSDSEAYAAFSKTLIDNKIRTNYLKKRRVLVGCVKKVVDQILEEEYDDIYYTQRHVRDLALYKKANWQRGVDLVLSVVTGRQARSKSSQRLTGFQDPYWSPRWHMIKANAPTIVKIKELYDEVGAELTDADWAQAEDMKPSDFSSSEAAAIMIKMEQNAGGNKDFLNQLLQRPARQRVNLVVEDDDITRITKEKEGKEDGKALPPPAEKKEKEAAVAVASE